VKEWTREECEHLAPEFFGKTVNGLEETSGLLTEIWHALLQTRLYLETANKKFKMAEESIMSNIRAVIQLRGALEQSRFDLRRYLLAQEDAEPMIRSAVKTIDEALKETP